jgi:hypothetical protein
MGNATRRPTRCAPLARRETGPNWRWPIHAHPRRLGPPWTADRWVADPEAAGLRSAAARHPGDRQATNRRPGPSAAKFRQPARAPGGLGATVKRRSPVALPGCDRVWRTAPARRARFGASAAAGRPLRYPSRAGDGAHALLVEGTAALGVDQGRSRHGSVGRPRRERRGERRRAPRCDRLDAGPCARRGAPPRAHRPAPGGRGEGRERGADERSRLLVQTSGPEPKNCGLLSRIASRAART